MKRLARGQRPLAADCIAESWVFIAKTDVVQTIAVFKVRRAATRTAGENHTVSAAKTYWTFVVHARSHFHDFAVRVCWTQCCGWSIMSPAHVPSIETQELGGNVRHSPNCIRFC